MSVDERPDPSITDPGLPHEKYLPFSDPALGHIVQRAVDAVAGCDWAGITRLSDEQRIVTAAATHAVVCTVDDVQSHLREGPYFAAATEPLAPVVIEDFGVDTRWPRFAAEVTARTRIRTLVVVPLSQGHARTFLTLYGRSAGTLRLADVESGTLLADAVSAS